ncbi:hypothetical protein [Deinococcus sp. QL22]|uniref:hypothetical protein n=1 Tax=Deinococcus sp. QL22 TaxID=2939437 RepID=UPI002017EC37|nr:hypothetical protein [Deinococcus sp. QL22]UQN07399.1 hypothetical protein M1R55_05755 [Deinococcus sp. QL22]
MTGKQSPPTNRVLLYLSLEDQTVSDIQWRARKSGGPISREWLKKILKKLVSQNLAHMGQKGDALSFRLAVGPAVEAALDQARAAVQASA